MTYNKLEKMILSPDSMKAEYNKRFNSPCTIRSDSLPQTITHPDLPLFIYNLPRLTFLISQVYKNSNQLIHHYSKLDLIEQEELIDYLLTEELVATSELENTTLKRKKISQFLQQLKEKHTKQPENSLVSLYFSLTTENQNDIKSFISDNLDSTTKNLYSFLEKDDDNFPKILRIFIFHYLFIKSLPNQQDTARFIYSFELSKELDILSALLVSQGIGSNQKQYLLSFSTLDNPENFNEATFYVIDQLTLLISQQQKLIEKLEINHYLRSKVTEQLQSELQKIPFAFDVFEVYFDHALYYPKELLSRKSILSFAHKDISPYMMRKIEALLLEKNLIEKRGEKPVTYRLNPKVIEAIMLIKK